MIAVNEEMIKALESSRTKLSEEALSLIKDFLKTCLHPKGGFTDRAGVADSYYSVFGYFLSYILDLELDIKAQKSFIEAKKKEKPIDFIHAVSIFQCSLLVAALELKSKNKKAAKLFSGSDFIKDYFKSKLANKVKKQNTALLDIIESYRSLDGGFNHMKQSMPEANIYATFLVWGLYQDIGVSESESKKLLNVIDNLQLADGSYVNVKTSKQGVTSATSAALIMQMAKGEEPNPLSIEWLKNRFNKQGGCALAENVPIADLLNTSTALLSLKLAGISVEEEFLNTAEFINLHWDESGGFFGSISDMIPDCEYTFYALLALGLI